MKRLMLFLVLFLFPLTAIAGEKIKGTNFYVVDNQSWKTGEGTGYWIWHGNGILNSALGPSRHIATSPHLSLAESKSGYPVNVWFSR